MIVVLIVSLFALIYAKPLASDQHTALMLVYDALGETQ